MDFTEIHQKVSSSDCGKFWLDLNPMTKLIMVLCGVATSILLPGFAFGFAWAILLLIFASTCGKGKQMGAAMVFIFVVFVIVLVTARDFSMMETVQSSGLPDDFLSNCLVFIKGFVPATLSLVSPVL